MAKFIFNNKNYNIDDSAIATAMTALEAHLRVMSGGEPEPDVPVASQGLAFTLKDDGTYEVSGIGECTDLDVVIPTDVDGISVTSIGDYALASCTSLRNVVISYSVKSIGGRAFMSCSSLTSVVIGDSVETIDSYAFENCKNLTSITVSGANAHYQSIDGNLYTKDGKTLIKYAVGQTTTSFVIPNSVTSIEGRAFEYCDRLTSVVIGDSVKTIGSSAFYYCTSLTSVVIPDSVTSIAKRAFEGCSNLTDVYYKGTEVQWGSISIKANNTPLTQATIHYNYVPVN